MKIWLFNEDSMVRLACPALAGTKGRAEPSGDVENVKSGCVADAGQHALHHAGLEPEVLGERA
ncbi:hypothetical protein [Fulvimarina sp. 2208YS6-2-32]|uniref:hypothetical protein n=1 Tax=Fulvimarina uroteuthidis TaxID=3098149 RepID=UPI002AC8E7B4|nr:hypothetical protein [Fulvimarina sp. 2208YS6-2-32]